MEDDYLMKTKEKLIESKDGDALVEALICVWKIDKYGHFMK